jgi:signal transduction histidine kinase
MTKRIFVTILVVAFGAVLLFGVPLAIAVDHRNQADAVVELERLATTAAAQVPINFAMTHDPIELPSTEDGGRLAIYDSTGRLVAGQGPTDAGPIVRATVDGRTHDGTDADERVVAVPIAANERVIGAVRATEPLSEVAGRTGNAWIGMAVLAAGIVLAAGVIGLILARHLTRPLRQLRDAAVQIGDGNFTVSPAQSGVAEVDDVAAALALTASRLGDLVERERRFTADASHQLRTPLASLRIALEAELAHPRDDARLALREALTDVERLDATVAHLLALARDDDTQRGPTPIEPLLTGVERRWHGPLADAGRPLRINVSSRGSDLQASGAAVDAILEVLVDNATRHGKGIVTIDVADAARNAIRITVRDEGAISSDDSSLFRRRAASTIGHGIGLALARSLAHAENGRLRLARMQPTTFELTVPKAATARK